MAAFFNAYVHAQGSFHSASPPKPADGNFGAWPIYAETTSVSLIVVGFNSEGPLRHLLSSLAADMGRLPSWQIVVVNNSLEDAPAIADVARDFGCVCVQNDENIGYGAAATIGAANAGGDYLLFLNPDVVITQGSIAVLVEAAIATPDGVAFGPVLFDEGRRRRGKSVSIADPVRFPWWRARRKAGKRYTAFLPGCALLVEADAFRLIGGFDENIFLFHEDDDLCIRLRELGALYIVEAAAALHSHGRASGDPEKWRSLKARSQGHSMHYVMRKHRGKIGVSCAIARLLLRCLSPLNWLSGRYRTKTFQIVSGFVLSMRHGSEDRGRILRMPV
jgi:GT2 family glycosyltransferase